MFTEITEDTISATDSCQMETTGTGKSILGIFLLKLLVDAQNETNWAIEENNLEEDLNLIANGLNYNLKMGYVADRALFLDERGDEIPDSDYSAEDF